MEAPAASSPQRIMPLPLERRFRVARSSHFRLDTGTVRRVLGEVLAAVLEWREVATSVAVGVSRRDLDDFAPPFENAQVQVARKLLR